MRTIEEIAIQCAENNWGDGNDASLERQKKSCLESIEEVLRWIPIEDDLPEKNDFLLDTNIPDVLRTKKILVKTDMGTVTDNRRIKMAVGEKQWVWFMNYDGEEITHWRIL